MEIGAKLEGKGMKVHVYMENGVRHMTNNKHPIRVPEDMKGLKIRVMEQPIYIEMMKALGANPTPMAFGELFTALQQVSWTARRILRRTSTPPGFSRYRNISLSRGTLIRRSLFW
jgi:hypothetical protein